jgi:hypothetical protein
MRGATTTLRFLFVTSVAACCGMSQAPAAAEGFDGKSTGTFSCAKLSFTKGR